jgi:hypothetical protein
MEITEAQKYLFDMYVLCEKYKELYIKEGNNA